MYELKRFKDLFREWKNWINNNLQINQNNNMEREKKGKEKEEDYKNKSFNQCQNLPLKCDQPNP